MHGQNKAEVSVMSSFVRRSLFDSILATALSPLGAWAQDAAEGAAQPEASTEGAAAEGAPEASVTSEPAAGTATVEPGKEGTIKDRSVHESRPYTLSAMLYVPWWYGIGIGVNARFEIPVVKDGFIPQINDQFSIEPSLSFDYRSRGYGFVDDRLKFIDITPAVYAMWSFHITPKFRPYGAIGLGYNIGIWLDDDEVLGRDVSNNYFYFDVAAGLFYNFSEHVALRAELGAVGPKVGLAGVF
jgi:opacity protein-like surface antigen